MSCSDYRVCGLPLDCSWCEGLRFLLSSQPYNKIHCTGWKDFRLIDNLFFLLLVSLFLLHLNLFSFSWGCFGCIVSSCFFLSHAFYHHLKCEKIWFGTRRWNIATLDHRRPSNVVPLLGDVRWSNSKSDKSLTQTNGACCGLFDYTCYVFFWYEPKVYSKPLQFKYEPIFVPLRSWN